MEGRQPERRVIAHLGTRHVHDRNRLAPPGQHCQFVIETVQVELDDNGIVPLLDQELSAFWQKVFADQFELGLGQAKPADIVLRLAAGVRQQDPRRGLP